MFSLSAQTPRKDSGADGLTSIEPLKIGSPIPMELWDLPLAVINHPEGKNSIRLHDFRSKKLIILDFWATWCGTCIASMPRIHALQDSFDKDMIVLPITGQSESTAGKFIAHNAYLSPLRLNSIVGDTTISKFFPHTMIPHVIWIVDGRVYAISNSKDITKENIKNALDQIPSRIPLKVDAMDYNSEHPLLLAGNGAREDFFLSRSIITDRIEGIPSNLNFLKKNESTQSFAISATNVSLRSLYSLAFEKLRFLPINRIAVDKAIDTADFERRFFKELYCYEWNGPLAALPSAKIKIQTDLNTFFSLNVRVENRRVKCFVIQKDDSKSNRFELRQPSEYLSAWVKRFNRIPGNPPLIDDSENGSLNVDLMDAMITNLDHINKKLARHGIRVVEVVRNLDMLVISPLNN